MTTPAKPSAVVITRFPYESSWGGEESHTISIAKYLREKGAEVIFMGSCPVLLEHFKNEGFKTRPTWGGKMCVTPWELIKSFFLFPFIKWNLAGVFSELCADYDVQALYCLSLNEKLLLTSEANRRKIPVTWVEHQEIRDWLLKSPWSSLYVRLASLVRIVPISQKNKRCLDEQLKIPPTVIIDIVNGVALENVQPRKTQRGLVLSANRFIPKKGVMDFVQALPELFSRHSDLQVHIIGEGEQEAEIQKYIVDHLSGKNIQIDNFLKKEKWFELLSQADVFVCSPRDTNETFSLNTAEALASGCKVVVTKCAGIADFLSNGVDAIITEPMNPTQLVQSIEVALSSSESMRESAIKTAREKFDQQRMLREYEKLILRSL